MKKIAVILKLKKIYFGKYIFFKLFKLLSIFYKISHCIRHFRTKKKKENCSNRMKKY